MKYYYLDKSLAEKNEACLLTVSSTRIDNYRSRFNENAIEFIGDNLPFHITYVDGKVREATKIELIKRNELKLYDGQYINENDEIVMITPDDSFIKPRWEISEKKWVESANMIETNRHYIETIKYNLRETLPFETQSYKEILPESVINDAFEYRKQMLETLLQLEETSIISRMNIRNISIPKALLKYI